VKPHLTPVHCYTLTNQHGDTRYLLINGGYCDGPPQRQVEAEHPGWTVTEQTWRSDWTHLAAPSNSEPDYGSSYHPSPSQPPWQSSPENATTQAA
jgi:hypothetical protein